MDPEFDLQDILPGPISNHAAPAGRKFRPKAKLGPTKVATPASVNSTLPNNCKEIAGTSTPNDKEIEESLESAVDTARGGLESVAGSSCIANVLIETEGLPEDDDEKMKLESRITIIQNERDFSSFKPQLAEVMAPSDTNVNSRCLITQANSSGLHMDHSVCLIPVTEDSKGCDDGRLETQGTLSCEEVSLGSVPLHLETGESDQCKSAVPSVPREDQHADLAKSTGDDSDAFLSLETNDILNQCLGTFQSSNENSNRGDPSLDAVDLVSTPSNPQFFDSEAIQMVQLSIHTLPFGDVIDYSSSSFTDCIHENASAADPPARVEQTPITGTNLPDHAEHLINGNEMLEKEKTNESKGKMKVHGRSSCKLRPRKSAPRVGHEPEDEESAPADIMMNGDNKSSHQLRLRKTGPWVVHEEGDNKSSCQLRPRKTAPWVHGLEDEEGAPSDLSTSALDEEDGDREDRVDKDDDHNNDSDDEYIASFKSKKKKVSGKPKKPATDEGKFVRKRKKTEKAPEQSNQRPRKKFSHSTRWRKERVKQLLSIPELIEENLPMNDIILLAEYREQLVKKEAKMSRTAVSNQSRSQSQSQRADDSFWGSETYNEEDPVAPENDGEGSPDAQMSPRAGSSYTLFNSHSFMKREPPFRWSKQDTELFYEGIRQFGSDLSLTKQLFPQLSRRQVKTKFDKEKRQNPIKLNEALTSRASDYFCFKRVIKQLQEDSTCSESAFKDESDRIPMNEEAELDFANNDGMSKPKSENGASASKQDEDAEIVNDEAEARDIPDIDGGDDDLDPWDLYESTL